MSPRNGQRIERMARAIAESWGYNWDANPADDNHHCVDFCDCIPETSSDEQPSRVQFRKAAKAALGALHP